MGCVVVQKLAWLTVNREVEGSNPLRTADIWFAISVPPAP